LVEARFFPAIWAMELLFLSVDPVVAVFPLAFQDYGGLYLCFCFAFLFFLFVSGRKAKIKRSSLGKWWPFVSFNGGFGLFFICFHRLFRANLHNPVAFLKTRAPQPSSPSSSTPVAGSTVHVGRQSPARGVYAPESSLFFGVRDGHAPPFSGHARWGCGLWWLIYGWVAPVTARAPTRCRLRQSSPLPLLPAS
jgi:hypothetical protein